MSIREKCRVNANKDADVFVGIRCEHNDISVNFPLGYEIASEEKELRQDILLLLNTIRTTTSKKESEVKAGYRTYHETAFPIQAYMEVIYDFYARGYYKEREVIYCTARRGKTDWSRTIKTRKPYIQNHCAYYLDFVTKKNSANTDEMITLIHEFCVYESFAKIGWLFTAGMPAKPKMKYNEKLFKSVLKGKTAGTFNDKNRRLFMNMLAIIEYMGTYDADTKFQYGTYRFEYVWEALIDRVYGISGKENYFPRTYWNIESRQYPNKSLEPDAIMVYNGAVYVLDAKYYKYGATKKTGDLPESASVHKQITYGEYVAEQNRFKELYGENFKVYNAFLMPFNPRDDKWNTDADIVRVGEAYGDWKQNDKTYEKVQGIVIDIKHLMQISTRQNEEEIMKLAEQIEQFV